ncbi:S-layer homology domain-containing protein [Geosporobacter ferrireducens]|uniref:Glycoside hydrolase n=1 Tax=Geosporobacter ferrireducens TaxID=1424294 RepID=A0A1D8GDS1_9FIRM|nr:S-layer homology domain-containing protein [Geosporobacter ferrireducens]AOT69058.1 glycoside hydrolase [Geosporobacter ferrireducens]MTI56727.1 glycoside hydrolase [Geosporobacter ferrireducens]
MGKLFSNKLIKSIGILLLILTFLPYGQASASKTKFNMSYLYFGSTNQYISFVDKTKGSLNVVSPSYFDLNEDGSLKLTAKIDSNFIKEMHRRKIKVVPFLSNHWSREVARAALKNRERLAQEIADAVVKYNLDGINADLENITEEDQEDYVDFIKLLRQKLPKEKELSVAVMANPNGRGTGINGGHDYKGLAQHSDYLMVMAYDESYRGGPAGPVASMNFVEKSIQYAVKQVPADKVVLGIPFYGRYWNAAESTGGYGIHLSQIDALLSKYKHVVTFDDKSKSPKATFTIKAEDEKFSVLGRELEPGNYTVWYENEESIKYKLRLVQKYNIKGTGSWSLGQENAQVWNYYHLWLNGRYYSDIDNHWAQDAILEMDIRGWMKGTSSTQFSPSRTLNRAETVEILVKAMGLQDKTVSSQSFKDVPKSHWAWREIEIAKEYGMIQGKGNGIFAPGEVLTREQVAAMLDNLLPEEATATQQNRFKDMTPLDWSYGAVSMMSNRGVINGFEDGTFRPKEKITRAQMAAMMQKMIPLLENIPLNQ